MELKSFPMKWTDFRRLSLRLSRSDRLRACYTVVEHHQKKWTVFSLVVRYPFIQFTKQ